MVRMCLQHIVIHEGSDQQYIFLKEEGGERQFPIVIGFFEALAIDREVREVRPPRPLTHDLLVNTVRALGGTVVHVVVNRLHENTFYAKLVVRQNGKLIEIDSRPSDAIAVATRTKVPIYVEEEVLREVLRHED